MKIFTYKDYLIKLSKFEFNSREIEILSQMIKNSIIEKIGPEVAKNFINNINKKECGNMSALEIFLEKLIDESIEKGLKQGMEKGMEKGMKQGLEKGLEKGMEKGIEKGMEKGMEKGIEKGIEKGRKNIILKMLKKQMDDETIILMTEISRKELEQMKKSEQL